MYGIFFFGKSQVCLHDFFLNKKVLTSIKKINSLADLAQNHVCPGGVANENREKTLEKKYKKQEVPSTVVKLNGVFRPLKHMLT